MKLVPHEQLLGLPVYTEGGEHLGRVLGFVLDMDAQTIVQYRVKHRGVFPSLLNKESLLIARDQVIEINEEKMVVMDAVIAAKEPARKAVLRPEIVLPEAGGVLQRETNES